MADAPQPWRIVASRRPLVDRWISVRADDCETVEGVPIAPYYVLEYADWVQVVAIDTRDHVILVEQYRHGAGVVTLELPAGGVDPGDADAIAAGKRELREETGYGGGAWQQIGLLSPNPATHANRAPVILATGVTRVGDPADDPTERIRVLRLPFDEAIARALDGTMTNAMHVAALLMAAMLRGEASCLPRQSRC